MVASMRAFIQFAKIILPAPVFVAHAMLAALARLGGVAVPHWVAAFSACWILKAPFGIAASAPAGEMKRHCAELKLIDAARCRSCTTEN